MERKLTAILCADVHGYSRLMGQDEAGSLATLTAYRKIIGSLIEQHRGRFVNSAGDSVLAEFASVVNAVQCALEIQASLKAENTSVPPERRMEFRIGVNLGDVMVEAEQIYGDGVNVAARLDTLAEPGGICISDTVHAQMHNKLPLSFQDLGNQWVKNIAQPVRVWRVTADGATSARKRVGRFCAPIGGGRFFPRQTLNHRQYNSACAAYFLAAAAHPRGDSADGKAGAAASERSFDRGAAVCQLQQ